MEIGTFAANVWVAVGLGAAIGLERQWGQHPAGLRTNTLVATGAALFVSLTFLLGDAQGQTRVASYIVSGLGFLGGGVILKEGAGVRGLNTAATIWCSGAVGTLAGAGFPLHAAAGAATVLAVHLGMRPLAGWVDARRKGAEGVEARYRVRAVCPSADAAAVRAAVLRGVNAHPRMAVRAVSVADADRPGLTAAEPGVTAAGWEKNPH